MDYRKGMWVTSGGHIGILAEIDPRTETAEIHFTDAEGYTVGVLPGVPFDTIAQSAYSDIPESRRPTTDVALSLGYL